MDNCPDSCEPRRNTFLDCKEKCQVAPLVRFPSLNRTGLCDTFADDIPSIGPLLTYHSQLDDLELKELNTRCTVLKIRHLDESTLGIQDQKTSDIEPDYLPSSDMLKKRGSIVEARIAFVADMVKTKTNEENGELEEVPKTIGLQNNPEDTFREHHEASSSLLKKVKELSLAEIDSEVCQQASDDKKLEKQEQNEIEVQKTDSVMLNNEINDKNKEEEFSTTLENIERERRKIIDKQVVRRKKIETWTINNENENECEEPTLLELEEASALQCSLTKYMERKQQTKNVCQKVDRSQICITEKPEEEHLSNLVDFGSILERKQELKHFWERKMMEVVSPDTEENRLPPVVINGHCKLKQNGVITKCGETGITETEMDRRPSPEGEESKEIVSEKLHDSLESQASSLSQEEKMPEITEQQSKDSDDREQQSKHNEEKINVLTEDTNVQVSEITENVEEKEPVPVAKSIPEIIVHEITEAEKQETDTNVDVTDNETSTEIEENICKEDELKTEENTSELETTVEEEKPLEKEEDETEYVESVMDREIRLQQEREESFKKERKAAQVESVAKKEQTEVLKSPSLGEKFHNNIQSTERPYCTHTTESRIALEIREMREREEELRRMRESSKIDNVINEQPAKEHQPIVEKVAEKQVQKEVQVSNVGIFRKKRENVTVRPLTNEEDDTPVYKITKESPIEREIRLVKEREEELRREKGLTVIETPPKKSETLPKVAKERPNSLALATRNGDTQRLLATNRIQQEIEEQTKRELDLRETGHIRTISQDTAERPLNGSIYKNPNKGVNIKKFLASYGKNVSVTNGVEKEEDVVVNEYQEMKPPQIRKDKIDARFPLASRRSVSAEIKIQQELMEMNAREEELRQQRSKMSPGQSQPAPPVVSNGINDSEQPNNTSNPQDDDNYKEAVTNDAQQNGNNRRRRSALIDQWEQRIQNVERKFC